MLHHRTIRYNIFLFNNTNSVFLKSFCQADVRTCEGRNLGNINLRFIIEFFYYSFYYIVFCSGVVWDFKLKCLKLRTLILLRFIFNFANKISCFQKIYIRFFIYFSIVGTGTKIEAELFFLLHVAHLDNIFICRHTNFVK